MQKVITESSLSLLGNRNPPMFKIAGYGSVSIMTKIEDSYFDDNGAFSEKCKVYLGVTRNGFPMIVLSI